MKPKSDPIERFWSFVSKDCWVFTGGCNELGYGLFYWHGKPTRAHRVSWEIHNGPIPAGMKVMHKCDNRQCIRPDHLALGTQQDNVDDMIQKGRAIPFGMKNAKKTHCPRGHEYNEANTYRHAGRRNCRTCKAEKQRQRAG